MIAQDLDLRWADIKEVRSRDRNDSLRSLFAETKSMFTTFVARDLDLRLDDHSQHNKTYTHIHNRTSTTLHIRNNKTRRTWTSAWTTTQIDIDRIL